jgi:gamma-glutamyltranspeptidase/glutathione hydrolase
VTANDSAPACIATPHHLASAAGLEVLAAGGNAMDAAIAANLVLGVVTPYLCGYGGDLFALVWRDGPFAYNGSGSAPAAATPEAVRAAAGDGALPKFGPLTVTVPGAVEAWFVLLDTFGTRSFEELARPALGLARDGFPVSAMASQSFARARLLYEGSDEWQRVYANASDGALLVQPDLAHTIETLSSEGPEAYYHGAIAHGICEQIQALGGLMDTGDLAEHRGEWVEPMHGRYRGVEVLELPPNTQGVTALEALAIVEALGPLPADGPDRQHLLIEAVKLALADRNRYVTDPEHMPVPAETLISSTWIAERARQFDPARASDPGPGLPASGGTAYLCAADGAGMLVSLIQSNWMGFGSGVTVPGWGINLHNRGQIFSLDPGQANVIAPRKRTLHTLIPAMALRKGRPWLVFGTMGGDGQPQTHLQLLAGMVDDGQQPQAAIDAPRWVVSPADWSVTVESRFARGTVDGLRARGHRTSVTGELDRAMGHAHAIRVDEDGYLGGTDPRAEGAVLYL